MTQTTEATLKPAARPAPPPAAGARADAPADAPTTTQAVSVSFFRFPRLGARLWALGQMQWAHGPMRRLPGIGFYKLFGTGSGQSFRPSPNLGVFGILATWPDLDHARAQVAQADIFRRYRDHASESWTVYLRTIRVRGAWDGQQPFEAEPAAEMEMPVAILTRASIRPHKAFAFWREAPDIDDQTARESAMLFKMGLGELPWLRQATFSIWSDFEAMRNFAYIHPFHRDAAKTAFANNWFSEYLFARFRILGAEGSWDGRAPLAPARPTPPA